MDNHRLILFAALSIVLLLLYDAWQAQFHPPVVTPPAKEMTGSPEAPRNSDTPSLTAINSVDQPQTDTRIKPLNGDAPQPSANSEQKNSVENKVQSSTQPSASTPATKNVSQSTRVRVKTDLLHVELDSKGADIKKVTLNKYPVKISEPNNPLVLFSDELPNVMISQSGFLGVTPDQTVNHLKDFTIDKDVYELAEGEQQLSVTFSWKGDLGREIRKVYTFHRNQYVIDLHYEVRNAGSTVWRGQHYRQIKRNEPSDKDQSRFVYTYTGGVVSRPDNAYEKVNFADMNSWKPENAFDQGGWVAMLQHYFLGAIIPADKDYNKFYTQISPSAGENFYIVGLLSKEVEVAPGTKADFDSKFYIGPKEQDRLEAANENLRLTVDYGILTVLARPLYWVLEKFHDWFGNWGVAIILVTLLVKLLFYKLSEKSFKSMAKMRKFQPKLQALKERFGDDKQRYSQAMMELYRKEKMNPFGGCLPMLVQIPVFISLYWVLLESVELRQAPFIFWIHDLSAKDPFYVLPVIMGISMFLQQKLNPSLMDPMQQKVMQLLPVFFTVFMAWFPSGLVLYWVVNNILGILQQWYITRKIEAQ